jgi:hypothetical protein
MKHTPGKWEVTTDYQYIITNEVGIEIANTPLGQITKQNEANAHLIASAPELLKACKEALRPIEENRQGKMICEGELDEVWDLIKQAIAKAEGKE